MIDHEPPKTGTSVLDQLNNIEEAQQKLGGLGRTRIFHLLQTGELQSVKIGRRRFIPDSSLQQYIEGLKAAAMSEQRGLHNPDTHGTTSDGEPYCESCGVCDEGWRCRCCLAAEVEALRAQVQADEEAERSLRERYNDLLVDHGKLTAQVQALRAQVQRVREACEPFGPMGSIAVWRVLRALDGDA